MSIFTSIRDSVENGVGGLAQAVGMNIKPMLSVGAGGDPNLPAVSLAGAAAPSGATGRGGVPNINPMVAGAISNQTLLILGGAILLLFVMVRGR